MNTYIVYKHTNIINNKSYIGITRYGDNPNRRWKNGYGYIENDKFFQDIIQFGWNNFTHEILKNGLDELSALKYEQYYIEQYNSIENGYNNVSSSGSLSQESRDKISQALTGIKRETSSINKQMQTKQQRYGTSRGIHYLGSNIKKVKCNETGDIFASIAEANRWANTCKVGECCNGHRLHAGIHPITHEQLSWSFANDNDEISIVCEEDRKEKKIIHKIVCIETKKIYENASEASRDTGVAICNILRVCKGERKSAGGLHWRFKEE